MSLNNESIVVLFNALTNIRKYVIIPENVKETFQLNLEDNIAYDLFRC